MDRILEAIGLPLLATAVGGVPELVFDRLACRLAWRLAGSAAQPRQRSRMRSRRSPAIPTAGAPWGSVDASAFSANFTLRAAWRRLSRLIARWWLLQSPSRHRDIERQYSQNPHWNPIWQTYK